MKRSRVEADIFGAIESVVDSTIRIRDVDDKAVAMAMIISTLLPDETVADHSDNDWMEDWYHAYEDDCEEETHRNGDDEAKYRVRVRLYLGDGHVSEVLYEGLFGIGKATETVQSFRYLAIEGRVQLDVWATPATEGEIA